VLFSGITFELLHIPSETVDHSAIWLPSSKVLLCGDIVYGSYQNIFTLRGETSQSSHDWYKSIDRLRRLRAKHLLPAHTPPLSDENEIENFLTNYRDAIQFLNDQTIRLFNKHVHVDDMVRRIRMPSTLAHLPYLQELYGTLSWSVRGIYANYSGWFHGEPQELFPLSEKERALKVKEMLTELKNSDSPVEKMIESSKSNARKAEVHFNRTGAHLYLESQWSLEIANLALLASENGSPEHERAKAAKVDALKLMAAWSTSINAKYYFLSSAAEMQSSSNQKEDGRGRKTLLNNLDMNELMEMLPVTIDSEKCDPTALMTVVFYFTDTEKYYAYILRNCVMEFINDDAAINKKHDVKLSMRSQIWRDILTNERGGFGAYMSGDIVIDGSMMLLKVFLNCLSSD